MNFDEIAADFPRHITITILQAIILSEQWKDGPRMEETKITYHMQGLIKQMK